MKHAFWTGGKEGFHTFLPVSVGLIPWALVTGITMTSSGLTFVQAMGMNIIVYAGTAQLATLPLIKAGAPIWLIVLTGLVLNLRFLIFSAAIAPGFRGSSTLVRWFSGYLLGDGVFASCAPKMLLEEKYYWRLGYYLIPSLWSWLLWQLFGGIGIISAKSIPGNWSLEFMATIALIVLLIPMTKVKSMAIAAIISGSTSLLLKDMPFRLGMVTAMCAGIIAGFLFEQIMEPDIDR